MYCRDIISYFLLWPKIKQDIEMSYWQLKQADHTLTVIKSVVGCIVF